MSLVVRYYDVDGSLVTVDLADYGVVIQDTPEGRDGIDVDWATAHVPGYGPVELGVEGEMQVRRITVDGGLKADDHATIVSNIRELKWILEDRELQLILPDDPTHYFVARLESPRLPPIAPTHSQRMSLLHWTFLCTDPHAFSTSETTIDFNAFATAVPIGSGDVRPVITVVGLDAFDVIHRSSAGVEVGRIRIEGAGTGEVVIDCENQVITLDGEEAPDLLVDSTDFIVLTKHHAGGSGGPHQTLEISPAATASAAQAVYRAKET